MKKYLKRVALSFFMVVLFTGCSVNKEKTYLETSINQNDVNMRIKIELVHDDKKVYNQNQDCVIVTGNQETYDDLLAYMKETKLSEKAKQFDGADYELIEDKENFKIIEKVYLDFDKLCADGYKTMTLDSVSPEENYFVEYESTLKNLQSQGFEIIER